MQPPRPEKATCHTTRQTPPHGWLHLSNVYGPRLLWARPMPTVRPSLGAADALRTGSSLHTALRIAAQL